MSIGCRDLRVTAHGRELVSVRALDVPAGETLAVLGPNGAGKSTLLRALAHLGAAARSGSILLDGQDATTAQLRQAVAAVLQRPVLQRKSVLDNAAAGLRLRGVRRGEARRRAEPWLDALGVAHLADRQAHTLSGGESQRVAIARALAVAPRVLLLDEPFTGLDATTRTDLLADLRAALNEQDAAVLLVTHDREEARALAQRTALLVGGEIRQIGATADVLDAPTDLECATLLGFTTHLPPALTGHQSMLVARPERCRPLTGSTPPPPDTVVVDGVLRRVVPLGGAHRLDVDTTSGTVTAVTTADVPTSPGHPIRIATAREHLRECVPPVPGRVVVGAAGPGAAVRWPTRPS
ncbi:ABC transporter ATP-binding protein [Actinophytocola algeriensis]|uniref:ABC-type sulfate/molybdate transport systems ATPase subunit n=1 Tax=Actinophytocola algeriensis TaxID=1768010 RepID=A0A7W7VFS8_9PSEU|nr:ATP-binding cassette domain-containing protein [Actinophytocola algeriensis]MBB4908653.1 ABC-type sulfate/molybdate transport systems ATPase subunit [Actinophytocola algeriensis]MBE1474960.1 ABC-type sulfate/molybdate transport systems ATPase subunit [Actinophytocola algeriensis]